MSTKLVELPLWRDRNTGKSSDVIFKCWI